MKVTLRTYKFITSRYLAKSLKTLTLKILSVYPPENSPLLKYKMICYERKMLAFREQRLECDPPNEKFHDTLKKAKLKTFTDLNKKIKIKASKAERRLFAQMIVIAECRNLQMSEVLAHPLGPLPWTLVKPDGSLCKTNKTSLAKELQKNVQAANVIPQPSACLIDGMAMAMVFVLATLLPTL